MQKRALCSVMLNSVLLNSLKSIRSAAKSLAFTASTRHFVTEQNKQSTTMRVKLVPALKDNYMYLLIDDATRQAAVVDPVEPQKILTAARDEHVEVKAILSTHHHWDHAGGNTEFVKNLPGVPVYGGDDRIDELTNKVNHGDLVKLGELSVTCLATPCHTSGHVCYHVTSGGDADGVVFTGDTLFIGGCGRFFEGKPEQMFRNLIEVLGQLSPRTKVYCGHEYTVANLTYAAHVEPGNEAIRKKMAWAKSQRANNLPTVPSTIGDEYSFNPFMRVKEPAVQAHAKCSDPVSVMGALRAEKDNFTA